MQDVDGDVRREFAKDICERVATDGISVLAGNPTGGSSVAGIISQPRYLGYGSAEYFGGTEPVVPDNPFPPQKAASILLL